MKCNANHLKKYRMWQKIQMSSHYLLEHPRSIDPRDDYSGTQESTSGPSTALNTAEGENRLGPLNRFKHHSSLYN